MKNAFIIEDLSSLNSISMNVAGPIIASYGLRSLQLPVQNFITQTEMEGTIQSNYSSEWLKTMFETAHCQFKDAENVGLIGYLGKAEIIDLIEKSELINDFQLLLVDPVMADNGHYYPLLDATYCEQLKHLLPFADVVTPNITELACLTATRYSTSFSEDQVAAMTSQLRELLKPNAVVVVTGIETQDQVGCYWDDGVSCGTNYLHKINGHFYGTGDAFAATLLGELSNGAHLEDCLPLVMDRICQGVKNTLLDGNDLKLGVDITPLIYRNKKY